MTLLEQIKNAGIIGLGGAGFPTHIKMDSKPDILIINCAECEPVLRNDRALILKYSDKMVGAIDALSKHFGGIRSVFAIKENYTEEIRMLEEAIAKRSSSAEIFLLKGYYPAGDEQLVVYEVTGTPVPPLGIPLDVGAVVSNAATLYSIGNAMEGLPLIKRLVTVAGEVNDPQVVRVPIGTSYQSIISACGGAKTEDYMVVSGGPMMGKRMTREEAQSKFAGKTTSGILLLKNDSKIAKNERVGIELMKRRAASVCIQCRQCTDLCPRHLTGHPIEPHRIMRAFAYSGDMQDMLQFDKVQEAALCSECGVCELYACPMGLRPRTINGILKKLLKEKGYRYEKGKNQQDVHFYRSDRLAPSRRAASRAGVGEYYDQVRTDFVDLAPSRVEILLSQGIGVPAEPVVKTGDKVGIGDLIARCPEGKLGSDCHASIGGTVKVLDDRIIIE